MRTTGSGLRRLTWLAFALLLVACSDTDKPKAAESNTGDEEVVEVDPLPSWNDSALKTQIIEFVKGVTDPESPSFVEPYSRVAVFDHDARRIAGRKSADIEKILGYRGRDELIHRDDLVLKGT